MALLNDSDPHSKGLGKGLEGEWKENIKQRGGEATAYRVSGMIFISEFLSTLSRFKIYKIGTLDKSRRTF